MHFSCLGVVDNGNRVHGTTNYKGSSLSMDGHICSSDDVVQVGREGCRPVQTVDWITCNCNRISRPPRRLADVVHRPSRSVFSSRSKSCAGGPSSFDYWLESKHPQLINVIHICTMEKIGV